MDDQKLYPDIIVGIKSAHYWGDFTQVDKAVQAGNLANVPVIVDFGEHDPPNSIEALFMQHLRPGDIFTHTYSYGPKVRETVVDENQKVKPLFSKRSSAELFLMWAMEAAHSPGDRLYPQCNRAFCRM